MSIMALAQQVQAQGRGEDTILAHITPEEAALLKSRGGSGTINPNTGLPEFNFFKKLWNGFKKVVKAVAPIIIPAVAIFVPTLIPSIGSWITGAAVTSTTAAVAGAAALSAGVTLASGGNLKQVLSSAALAGATTFLTPVIGKALSPAGASALTQGMIGSAAVGGGLAALRGGTVKEIIAAASTGAASAYLGNIARDAVGKINNMMQAGTIPPTVTEKGAIDATHIAADAANLKASGLTQQQVVASLKATGVNSIVAENAAQFTFAGDDASTVAANLAAGSPKGAYTGEANTKSISSGNNVDVVQRMEDARFVAADAAQLRAQGLGAADIARNLQATGVSESMANSVANSAVRGLTADQITNSILTNNSGFATSGKIFINPQDSVGRNLGQVMTAEQQKVYDALPFKEQINAGTLTVDQAAVLDNSGYKPADVTSLTKLGYTAADLTDLASTGVPASTLTSMANTKFAESTINSFFKAGASANDIATASNLVNTNKISLATAETALRRDFDSVTLNSIANNRGATAATVDRVVNSNLSAATINKLAAGGFDLGIAADAANAGADVNSLIAKNDFSGYRYAVADQSISNRGLTSQANYAADIDFLSADAASLARQGLTRTQIEQLLLAEGVDANAARVAASAASGSAGNSANVKSSLLSNKIDTVYAGKNYYETALPGVTSAESAVLKQAGFSMTDIQDLGRLGYSPADLADLASTGVTPTTLRTMAATPFAENQINDLFRAGASANDISTASNLVTQNRISVGNAEKLLFKDLDGATISNLINRGAATVDAVANSGLNSTAIRNGLNNRVDFAQATALQNEGVDVNSTLSRNDMAGFNRLVSDNPLVRDANGQLRLDLSNKPVGLTSTGMSDSAAGTIYDGPDGPQIVLDSGKTVLLSEYEAALASGRPISIDGQITTAARSNAQVFAQSPTPGKVYGPGGHVWDEDLGGWRAWQEGDPMGPMSGFVYDAERGVWRMADVVDTDEVLPPQGGGSTTGTEQTGGAVAAPTPAPVAPSTPTTTPGEMGPTYPVTPEVIAAANQTSDPIGAIANYVNTGVVPVPTPITPTTPAAPGGTAPTTPAAPTPPTEVAPAPTPGETINQLPLPPTPQAPVVQQPTRVEYTMPDGTKLYFDGTATYTETGEFSNLGDPTRFGAVQAGTTPPAAPVDVAPPAAPPAAPVDVAPPAAPPAAPTVPGTGAGVDYSITGPAAPAVPGMGGGTGITAPVTGGGTGVGTPGGVDYGLGGPGPGVDMGGGTGIAVPGTGTGSGTGTGPGVGFDYGLIPGGTAPAVPGMGGGTGLTPPAPVTPTPVPEIPVTPPVVTPPPAPPAEPIDATEIPHRDVLPDPEEPPPYVPLPVPVVPPETWKGWSPIDPLAFKRLPDLRLPGLNPGFIAPAPYYQTTSPVQSKYYWGARPYQPGPTFNQALYDTVPAPAQPWGLQQMYTPTNLNQFLQEFSTVGPIAPNVR